MPTEHDKVVRAAHFYYLNRNCFNGLYRTNKSGQFNVPFSKSRTGRMLTNEEFFAASKTLKNAKLTVCDFEKLIKDNLHQNSFFFLDPPYAVEWRQPFTEYNSSAFCRQDLARLIGCLEAIDDAGGRFALTYDYSMAKTFALRREWRQSKIVVRRNISGFADARRNAAEVLTTNYR
jgi:DNA adenine methylase